ncbi:hypothetical protein [Pelotalea chapellei]|uniref:Uncharacterized protein n=1 Tax=Pelotalea chapellei TaxID=44671 RepID=A0ABS5UAT9_9BACT|nr:hypothetical protein [Pelotalea chapellei]MBT1072779.1 hypothetical protein [Pelotalea chapellei]
MANNFYSYFRQNMESMNLPAPENLFGTLGLAVASAKTILSEIDKFGPTVTVAELIVAGTKLEILGVIGACSAMFYAGAVIGSIAVATGRSISGGVSIADVVFTANQYNLNRTWLTSALASGR